MFFRHPCEPKPERPPVPFPIYPPSKNRSGDFFACNNKAHMYLINNGSREPYCGERKMDADFDVWEPRYNTKEVCEATGVKMETLKTWFQRGLILGENETDVRENRTHRVERVLSFARVMQIAIMHKFCQLGLPASKAATVALAFTDIAEGNATWGDEVPTIKRRPGHLYIGGYTMLAAYPNEDFGHVFHIENKEDKTFYEKLFYPKGVNIDHLSGIAGLLNVTLLFTRVRAKLGRAHIVS